MQYLKYPQQLISVIIHMHNAEATIIHALNSISNQTAGQFEILITNDGSTDESLGLAHQFKMMHPELTIIIIDKEKEGASSARNEGLRQAKGSYIAFLDAADEWDDDKTKKQLLVFDKNPDISLTGCLQNSKPIKYFLFKKFDDVTTISCADLLFKNYFQPSAVIMKRDVFYETGFFNESRKYGEETNYFLRVSKVFVCAMLNEQLVSHNSGNNVNKVKAFSGGLFRMKISECQNCIYAFRFLKIPLLTCLAAILFSMIKFTRRLVIDFYRALIHLFIPKKALLKVDI